MGSRAPSTVNVNENILLDSPESIEHEIRKRKQTSPGIEVDCSPESAARKSKQLRITNPRDIEFQAVMGDRVLERQQSTAFPGSTFFPVPLSPRLSDARTAAELTTPATPLGRQKHIYDEAESPMAKPNKFHTVDVVHFEPVKIRKTGEIHSLVENGQDEKLEEYLKEYSSINEANDMGFLPLTLAVALEDEISGLSCLKSLLEAGADPRIGDDEGLTPLHWAAALNRSDAIRFLVDSGTPVHIVDKKGNTPLHCASKFGAMDALKLLIREFQANTQIRNQSGLSILDVAGQCGLPHPNKQTRKLIRKTLYDCDPNTRTLVLYHPECSEHCGENAHQEAPERIDSIMKEIKSSELLKDSVHISSNFPPASRAVLLAVHDEIYVDMVLSLHEKVKHSGCPVPFTPRVQAMNGNERIKDEKGCDTFFSVGSFPAAIRAAGAVCNAVDRVVQGYARNAFCCVRPPGHHAGVAGLLKNAVSCGFCIFNNVAVGAMHALTQYKETIQRIAIIDIDVHHGNGTEEIVSEKIQRPDNIFFFSIHLYDKDDNTDVGYGEFYPGSGKDDCISCNVHNAPLVPSWCQTTSRKTRVSSRKASSNDSAAEAPSIEPQGRDAFRDRIINKLIPALEAFAPDLLFMSSGFDAAKNDVGCSKTDNGKYYSGIDLRAEDYRWVTQQLQNVAQTYCKGRIVSVLEGGYGQWTTAKREGGVRSISLNRENLGKNACAHVEGLVM